MTETNSTEPTGNPRAAAFATTRWSVVARAGAKPVADPDVGDQYSALSQLCEAYWYPIYAFARRKGHGVEDARDLVQSFFARLIEHDDLAHADRERGRFRSFLLGCFVNFMANEWDRANAEKRGGGRALLSLDSERAEDRLEGELVDPADPERIFLRAWALTVIEQTVERVRAEYEHGEKSELFEHLRPTLTAEPEAASYREIAAEMETTEGAVKVAVHRLRKRFGTLLRVQIADTLRDPDPEEVEDEIRGLFEALN